MPFGLIQSKLVTENQGNAIGEQLRAARLDQGISFEQLVTRTKIRRHFLESLEKGDHGQLPSSLCAINFLRQYSDALGLNTDKLVKAFRDSTSNLDGKPARYVDDVKIGGGGIPFKKALSRTAGAGKDFAGRRSNLVVASALIVAGSIGWWSLGWAARQFKAPSDQAASAERSSPAQSSFGSSDASNQSSGSRATATFATADGAQVDKPMEWPASPIQPARSSSIDMIDIEIRADAQVWLRFLVDGGNAREATLQPGERLHIEAADRLELTAGNAGAITLLLNGEVQGSLGTVGQVRHLRITHDGWQPLPPGAF